jgi:hypothetical protein
VEPLKIFIGTSDANRAEQQVMVASIKRHTTIPYEIYLLNGDSSVITGPRGERYEVTVPPSLKSQYVTRFTAMRFQVPAVCGHRGLALYVDSDQITFADLKELVDSFDRTASFGAVRVPDAWAARRFRKIVLERVSAKERRHEYYLASVWLMNTERCRFDLESLGAAVAGNRVTYNDLIWCGPEFRREFGLTAQAISPAWNCLDDLRRGSKLLHFTDLSMQPWRHPHNPNSGLWLQAYADALRAGALTEGDIRRQHELGRLSWATLNRGLEALGKPAAPKLVIKLREAVRSVYWELFWQLKVAALQLKRAVQG